MPSTILNGEKFSYLAVPRVEVAAYEFNNDDNGILIKRDGPIELWATTEMPIQGLDEWWRVRLGENTADDIASASLYIVAKRVSGIAELNVEDAQSEQLKGEVIEFFKSLILASKLDTKAESWLTSGSFSPDTENIHRSFVPYPALYQLPGVNIPDIAPDDIAKAGRIAEASRALSTKNFARLNKAYRSFWLTARSRFFDERLHQAARCIEGLILPEQARTKNQFRSRTELFIGNREHKLMGNLYNLRSAIEHLNNPLDVIEEVEEEQKYLYMYTTMVVAEAIARYCITNILLSPAVMPHFKDDASITAFWDLPPDQRVNIWNGRYDVKEALEGFEMDPLVLDELRKVF